MPSLTNVTLPENVFTYTDDITVIGGIHSIHLLRIDIGALIFVVPFTSNTYCMNILEGSNEITTLNIGSRVCPFENATVFDLSVYPKLKTLKIGSDSFEYVNVFNITGLSELESVEIGNSSFTQYKKGYGNDPNRHFYLKNCPKLKSLKIGGYSFSDYASAVIESNDALEVIEMGYLNEASKCFYSASLELKSILIHSE